MSIVVTSWPNIKKFEMCVCVHVCQSVCLSVYFACVFADGGVCYHYMYKLERMSCNISIKQWMVHPLNSCLPHKRVDGASLAVGSEQCGTFLSHAYVIRSADKECGVGFLGSRCFQLFGRLWDKEYIYFLKIIVVKLFNQDTESFASIWKKLKWCILGGL